MSNRLKDEVSPYLLQHKDNPVDWYPWGEEAFARAREEDKPIFLSIGYSACHWCHVLAHESFEDAEIAELLNRYFIAIKVDKEERPDIDSVYMAVCQAFTGSGGWPTSIFMTPDQRPFFAGTYFPRTSRSGMIGLRELLLAIAEKWESDRPGLLQEAEEMLSHLGRVEEPAEAAEGDLLEDAVTLYQHLYDERYGGFGRAPKFPAPHNLLFLLAYGERHASAPCLRMAEHTLTQMYRGGIFDHIGFGFCRYSTDKRFLVPHFEKMLYDNALLILAYVRAYTVTKKELYLSVAEKTADYILREMTSPDGGFYSAQDADSEGEEGKYYLFTPKEVIALLGEDEGGALCRRYDISEAGNFEGKSIPNLLGSDPADPSLDHLLPRLAEYRRQRYALHRDDKILTAWNGLMIAAMCELYLVSRKECYFQAAKRADDFICEHLCEGERLFVSYREKKRGVIGFLDDYAAYILAQLALYRASLENAYLLRGQRLCDKVLSDFADNTGGFYLYSRESEELILRPKESYDGAIPSGNSLMAYHLLRLSHISGEEKYRLAAERQCDFLAKAASSYPAGHAMFLFSLIEASVPRMKITVVAAEGEKKRELALAIPAGALVHYLDEPSEEYPRKNGKTTYYVCYGHACRPPTNDPAVWQKK